MAAPNKSVLFVCRGNICRSPMAEALFREMVTAKDGGDLWRIDSAGTESATIGSEPDSRTTATLEKHGKNRSNHIARQITREDYDEFRYILTFDESNISKIKSQQPASSKAIVHLLGEYDPKGDPVIEDPYRRDMGAFQMVYDKCMRSLTAFLEKEFNERDVFISSRNGLQL